VVIVIISSLTSHSISLLFLHSMGDMSCCICPQINCESKFFWVDLLMIDSEALCYVWINSDFVTFLGAIFFSLQLVNLALFLLFAHKSP
jgi:hypothetical protein